jgi:hypothetical protein
MIFLQPFPLLKIDQSSAEKSRHNRKANPAAIATTKPFSIRLTSCETPELPTADETVALLEEEDFDVVVPFVEADFVEVPVTDIVNSEELSVDLISAVEVTVVPVCCGTPTLVVPETVIIAVEGAVLVEIGCVVEVAGLPLAA